MKKTIKFLLIVAIAALYSCQEDYQVQEENNLQSEKIDQNAIRREFEGDSIILQNPYSVSNMRTALQNIKDKNLSRSFADLGNFQINTSHYYIKFKPRNAADEALLKRDSTLYLFDYRLDCEYSQEYLENRVGNKSDSIPDYYTSISKYKTIPNVPYQIIEELYIPEQDKYFSDTNENGIFSDTYQVNNKTDLFNYLLHEAFILTGNQDELEVANPNPTSRWGFGKRWTPSGRITIEDNTLSRQVPLEGAKILMRQ